MCDLLDCKDCRHLCKNEIDDAKVEKLWEEFEDVTSVEAKDFYEDDEDYKDDISLVIMSDWQGFEAGTRPPKGMNEVQTKLYYGFALGGIDWMSLEELTQAIPPVYTCFLGKQIIEYLDRQNQEQRKSEVRNIQEILMSKDFIELVKKYMVS